MNPKISYEVGDKVSLIYLNEEGSIIETLTNDRYRVAVGNESLVVHECYFEPIYTLESVKNRIERLKKRILHTEVELDYMFVMYDELKKAE